MKTALAILCVFSTLNGLAARSNAEEVEHPAFKSWAAHPVGTSIAIRSVTSCPASRLTTTTTYKLLELKEDRAILETRKVSDATGQLSEGLPDKMEQRRKFPLLPGVKKEQIGKPLNPIAQGEETLKLAGREIKTFWYDTKGQGDAGETLTRTWMSEDVPGRLVKAVTKIPRADTTVTLELVEFKTP